MYCSTYWCWCIAVPVDAGVLQYLLLLVYCSTCCCWCIAIPVVAGVLQYLLLLVYCNTCCCWCIANTCCCWCIALPVAACVLQYMLLLVYCSVCFGNNMTLPYDTVHITHLTESIVVIGEVRGMNAWGTKSIIRSFCFCLDWTFNIYLLQLNEHKNQQKDSLSSSGRLTST